MTGEGYVPVTQDTAFWGPLHAAPGHMQVRIMSINFQDYYKTLGVEKNASQETIRSAYRKH